MFWSIRDWESLTDSSSDLMAIGVLYDMCCWTPYGFF